MNVKAYLRGEDRHVGTARTVRRPAAERDSQAGAARERLTMTNDDSQAALRLNDQLGQLLEGWANVERVRFVSRSSGQYTTSTVSRDGLWNLMRAVQAAERERCAKLCEEVHADTSECQEMALYCAARIRGA